MMEKASDTLSQPLPKGFKWGAVKAGIKASGRLDLAVALAPESATAAAMFTKNQVVAAPVTIGRRHIASTGGKVSVVLVNAGNANCATGQAGIDGCLQTCAAAAATFNCTDEEVLPSSTGIIGVPFPADKVIHALPEAKQALGETVEHAELFAKAIMTTDTRMKTAQAVFKSNGKTASIFGVAKGAGMIHPQLGPPHATMLVYLFTDVEVASEQLRNFLAPAVEQSFNCISIDGDTSTNDTVLLLASGASGIKIDDSSKQDFATAMSSVCKSLAFQIVDDGEGVGHVVTLCITGARSYEEAKVVARSIAHSPLCKTAWSSADPNWGRLLAAAGYSGVIFDADNVTIRIGDLPVFESGMRSPQFEEAAVHAVMKQREYRITLNLGQGKATCEFITCDLTEEYVHINADYST